MKSATRSRAEKRSSGQAVGIRKFPATGQSFSPRSQPKNRRPSEHSSAPHRDLSCHPEAQDSGRRLCQTSHTWQTWHTRTLRRKRPRLTRPPSPFDSQQQSPKNLMTAMNFLFRKPCFPIIIDTGAKQLGAKSWVACERQLTTVIFADMARRHRLDR